jgi:hypothetical protein
MFKQCYSIQGQRFIIIYNTIILGLKNVSRGSRQFGVSESHYAAVSLLEFFIKFRHHKSSITYRLTDILM